MDVLSDKGTDKLTTYANKSAEIKTDYTITANINSTLHKLSNVNPKGSKSSIHERITNLPSKTIKCWLCSNDHRLMNCETF